MSSISQIMERADVFQAQRWQNHKDYDSSNLLWMVLDDGVLTMDSGFILCCWHGLGPPHPTAVWWVSTAGSSFHSNFLLMTTLGDSDDGFCSWVLVISVGTRIVFPRCPALVFVGRWGMTCSTGAFLFVFYSALCLFLCFSNKQLKFKKSNTNVAWW